MSIKELLETYESALNTNDLARIRALYGSEPAFMPQHAPALTGRDAVRAGYEHHLPARGRRAAHSPIPVLDEPAARLRRPR